MNTLSFLTFFLGLTTGVHPVAVAVEGEVARVEVRLDGVSCGSLTEPPWRFTCDFGRELAPHELEALAFDTEGGEVAVARQLVNLAPRQSAVEMALERDGEARPTALLLTWRSVAFPDPAEVRVSLDGEPLPVEDPGRIPLPDLEEGRLHFAVAELTFPDGGTARTEIAFGASYGDRLSAENTAVPVWPRDGRPLGRPAEARGLLVRRTADGDEPLVPVAVESGAADLVVVMDSSAPAELASFQKDFAADRDPTGFQTPQARAGLEGGDRLYLLNPVPRRSGPEGTGPELFITSPARHATQGGLAWQLTRFRYPEGEPQRLADAVALAGMQAAAGGRPRAILLVLGPGVRDDSERSAADVIRFLQRLRVPLHVWWIERPLKDLHPRQRLPAVKARKVREQRLRKVRRDWREVRELTRLQDLVQASRQLREAVAGQRIVWVEGVHLPTEVAVAPAAEAVRLVAGGPGGEAAPEDSPRR